MILAQFDNIIIVLHVPMACQAHFSAQNCQSENYACTKDLSFRRSVEAPLIGVWSAMPGLKVEQTT